MGDLLNLSEDALIKVLTYLPLSEIAKLASINPEILKFMETENFWQARSFRDFPEEARNKPREVSWRDFYDNSIPKIPFYYHGDRFPRLDFLKDDIDLALGQIKPYIENIGLDKVNIVFINKVKKPLLIVKYPGMKKIVKSENLSDVDRIVLIQNDDFEPENVQIVEARPTRGRRQNLERGTYTREEIDRINNHIIINELTSQYGHPPIYGLERPPIGNMQGPLRFNIFLPVFGHADIRSNMPRGRECNHYDKNELTQIALDLGYTQDRINEARVRGRIGLCNLIKGKLIEIGHML